MFIRGIFFVALCLATVNWTPLPQDDWHLLSLQDFRGMRLKGVEGTGWYPFSEGFCLKPGDKAVDLITRTIYQDFEIEFSWWLIQGGNSGVKFGIQEKTGSVGLEMQLLDDERHPDAAIGAHRQTGALYDILPPSMSAKVVMEDWNRARLRFQGGELEHWINDELVLSTSLQSPKFLTGLSRSKFHNRPHFSQVEAGHILFQDHGDAVCFKNVRIRKL